MSLIQIIKEEIEKAFDNKPYFTVSFENYGYLEPDYYLNSEVFDKYKFPTYEYAVKYLIKYFKTYDAKILFEENPNEIIEIAKQIPVKGQEQTRYAVVKRFTKKDYDKLLNQSFDNQ